jgi:plastocyanin
MSSRWLAAIVLSGGALIAGCGGGDDSGGAPPPAAEGGGSATKLMLRADAGGKLAYDKQSLTAPAGTVTITMSNPSALSHDVSIDGSGTDEQGEVVAKGGTSTVTADLAPGTYAFYCSVPGHRAGGMEGTLTVK